MAQEVALKRGNITDSIMFGEDSVPLSLYLPSTFKIDKRYPLLLVLDTQGRARQAIGSFREVAEDEGYIVASPHQRMDTLAISDQVILLNKVSQDLQQALPLAPRRLYTAGFGIAGQMATLAPTFIKDISGTIGISAPIPSTEMLDKRLPFYYIGIVGNEDYNFGRLKAVQKALDGKDYPHHLLVFDGGHEWPDKSYLKKALQLFTARAMKLGNTAADPHFLQESLEFQLQEIRRLLQRNEFIRAYEQMLGVYRVYENQGMELDSLKLELRGLKRDRRLRTQKRELANQLFLESLEQEDYRYYLEEDLRTYNFNNIGWWRYQIENLREKEGKKNLEGKKAKRLAGYVNALIEDYIVELEREAEMDLGALQLLYMLKTVIEPANPEYYLQVISTASQVEDFGTALFYLEELLKQGYRDKKQLYSLENTALLRITPEFNALIEEYFKDSRYQPQ